MPLCYRHDVSRRTTLTLDDDVAARVDREARRTGRSFKETVNDAIRQGLDDRRRGKRPSVRLGTFPMQVRPGLDLDDVEALLDQIEGPDRR